MLNYGYTLMRKNVERNRARDDMPNADKPGTGFSLYDNDFPTTISSLLIFASFQRDDRKPVLVLCACCLAR